jgi:hypothetical protein
MSELTKILFGGNIVSMSGGYWIIEQTDVYVLSVDKNTDRVFSAWAQCYAFVSSIALWFLIYAVLPVRTFPNVVAAIIQTIAIFVVNLYAFRSIQNKPVHVNSFVLQTCPLNQLGVPLAKLIFMGLPLTKNIDTSKILVVNQRNLAPSKLDFFSHVSSKKKPFATRASASRKADSIVSRNCLLAQAI